MTVRFYGGSDDLIELEGVSVGPNQPSDDTVSWVATGNLRDVDEIGGDKQRFLVGREDEGVLVTVSYEHGVWAVMVSQVDEKVPIPWAITIEHHPQHRHHSIGYSVLATIGCPPGTPVKKDRGRP